MGTWVQVETYQYLTALHLEHCFLVGAEHTTQIPRLADIRPLPAKDAWWWKNEPLSTEGERLEIRPDELSPVITGSNELSLLSPVTQADELSLVIHEDELSLVIHEDELSLVIRAE